MTRKTCPVCRSPWEHDPAEGMDFLYRMRLADLVVGLSPDSKALDAEAFQRPLLTQFAPDPDKLMARRQTILDAIGIVQPLLARLESALTQWEASPAVQSLAEFFSSRGCWETDQHIFELIDTEDGKRLTWKSRADLEAEETSWLAK